MLQKAQRRRKIQADMKWREQVFRIGEQVLLSTKHLQLKNVPVRKLRKRFASPFFITKRIGFVVYKLELPQTWMIHPIFHTDYSKRLHEILLRNKLWMSWRMTSETRWRSCYDGVRVGLVGEGGRKSSLCFGQVIRSTMLHGHLPTILTAEKNLKR